MKFDATSKTIRGKQTWRFCVDKDSKNHYIEISDSYKSLRSDRMVTKNVCLRIDDQQLGLIFVLLEDYFKEAN